MSSIIHNTNSGRIAVLIARSTRDVTKGRRTAPFSSVSSPSFAAPHRRARSEPTRPVRNLHAARYDVPTVRSSRSNGVPQNSAALRSGISAYSSTARSHRSQAPSPAPSPPAASSGSDEQPSTESTGFLDSIRSKFSPSPTTPTTNARQQEANEQYAIQFRTMASSPTWTLTNVSSQLTKSISTMTTGWKSMIPGVRGSNKKQVDQLKAEKLIVDSAIEVLGGTTGVGIDRLKGMGRKEKLQIALRSRSDTSSINALVQNFESITILHRILRYRLARNLALPVDEEDAKRMMQTDIHEVLTGKEKREMQRARLNRGKGGGGR